MAPHQIPSGDTLQYPDSPEHPVHPLFSLASLPSPPPPIAGSPQEWFMCCVAGGMLLLGLWVGT